MTSRQRVMTTLQHEEPDRVPVDMGSGPVTGIAASTLFRLRQALGLARPTDRVKVIEPYQMLGEVTDDLRQALGIDVVGVTGSTTFFGFPLQDWKPWELFDGTPVLVPGGFNTEPQPNGDILMYPQGDKSAPPSGKMPAGGYYFDAIIRQEPIDEAKLDPQDNLEEFGPLPEQELSYLAAEARRLYEQTQYAVMGTAPGLGFGDIALVPAVQLKHPKGIRDVAEWYMSLAIRKDYVYKVFEGQCEIGLANLQRLAEAFGDYIQVIFISGTDFGTQRGPFASLQTYRELFKPFHKAVNDWVHEHTSWKTFIHTCGGVEPLIEEFIEAGFDILNPVQCSAAGMQPRHLKQEYGDHIVFWGGGVDTQKTLPFGTPEEVRRQVLERLEIFAPGGGFVFNTIHNIQPRTPVENILAMFEAIEEFNGP